MSEARDIYQSYLDKVSQALWDRDFDIVTRVKRYPYVIRHPDNHQVFETADDFRKCMETFRNTLEGLGATGYHRVCEHANFDPEDPTRITGAHWAYILRGGNYLTEPYMCEMVLVLNESQWNVTDIVVPQLRHGIPSADPGSTKGRLQ